MSEVTASREADGAGPPAAAAPPPLSVRLNRPEAFDPFYRREIAGVVALARALCGPAIAEDVAQEAMLAAYRRWDEVAELDQPGAWVRRVALNIATSTVRRRAVEVRALARLRGRRPVHVGLEPQVEEFWADVRQLPRRQAQVVALHYVDDVSVAEIAALLGMSEGSVKQHLSRGRQALAARSYRWTEVEQ